MTKSLRTFLYAGLGVGISLSLLYFFVFTPRMRAARDQKIRGEARLMLQALSAAESAFIKSSGTYTDNLTALEPWLKSSPRSSGLHYGFNPECLRTNGVAHSIGTKADQDLVLKLQAMFSELPCANKRNFTAMVAFRTSERLEIAVSVTKGEVASMILTDNSKEASTELETFRSLLSSLRSTKL